MSGRVFVDTNVFVYAFDDRDRAKQERALAVLSGGARGELVLSTQVLQEFFVAVTRKLARPLPVADAEQAVRWMSRLPLVQVDAPMVLAAIGTHRRHTLSFWDALVVEAASTAGCERLLTEDLQDGMRFGNVTVEDPFKDG